VERASGDALAKSGRRTLCCVLLGFPLAPKAASCPRREKREERERECCMLSTLEPFRQQRAKLLLLLPKYDGKTET